MTYEELYTEYSTPVNTHVVPEYDYDEDAFVGDNGELLELQFDEEGRSNINGM